jgi:hypothetical protein
MDWDDLEHIAHLEREIRVLESRILSSGTGHIHTAISVLRDRVRELTEPFEKDLNSDGIDL